MQWSLWSRQWINRLKLEELQMDMMTTITLIKQEACRQEIKTDSGSFWNPKSIKSIKRIGRCLLYISFITGTYHVLSTSIMKFNLTSAIHSLFRSSLFFVFAYFSHYFQP